MIRTNVRLIALLASILTFATAVSQSSAQEFDNPTAILEALKTKQGDAAIAFCLDQIGKVNDRSFQQAILCQRLGLLYLAKGQFALAQRQMNLAVDILSAFQSPPPRAEAQLLLARLDQAYLSVQIQDFVQSKSQYDAILKSLANKPDRDFFVEGQAQREMAKMYELLGEYATAERMYQESITALEQLRPGGNVSAGRTKNIQLGKSHSGLARLYLTEAKYAQARDQYLQAKNLVLAATGPDSNDTVIADIGLAMLNLQEAIEEKSEARLAEAAEFFTSALTVITNQNRLETYLGHQLNVNIAAFYCEKANQADRNNDPATAQAKRLEAQKYYLKAITFFEKTHADDLSHPDLVASRIKYVALLTRLNELKEAGAQMQMARESLLTYIKGVLPFRAEPEQTQFLQNKDKRWLHAGLTIATQNPNAAGLATQSAEWVINGKGILLPMIGEKLQLGRNLPEYAALSKTQDQLTQLAFQPQLKGEEITRREAAITELRKIESKQADAFALALERDASIKKQLTKAEWVSINQVQKRLANDVAYIDIVRVDVLDLTNPSLDWERVESRYYAWVITANSPVQLVKLGEATQVDKLVSEFHDQLIQDGVAFGELSRNKSIPPPELKIAIATAEAKAEVKLLVGLDELSDLILKPLLPHIGNKAKWIISPDGKLWSMPFNALRENNKYVIENHTVSHAFNGRDLLAKQAAPVNVNVPVMVGAVDYAKTVAFEPLPQSGSELADSQEPFETWANAKPELLIGLKAEEKMFRKKRNPKGLHICTHGFYMENNKALPNELKLFPNPLYRCGLAFSNANNRFRTANLPAENDGILFGIELLSMDLRGTDLVVLSACQTALGSQIAIDDRRGDKRVFTADISEGVLGLQYAFHLAGAKSVVGTLWEVSDKATADTVSDLFDQLGNKNRPIDEALRSGQLLVLRTRRIEKKASHPFFWAGFVVTQR